MIETLNVVLDNETIEKILQVKYVEEKKPKGLYGEMLHDWNKSRTFDYQNWQQNQLPALANKLDKELDKNRLSQHMLNIFKGLNSISFKSIEYSFDLDFIVDIVLEEEMDLESDEYIDMLYSIKFELKDYIECNNW